MKETVKLLENGFESSSGKTPEFQAFTRVFKKEFTKELKSIGATDIKFNIGHFYISGFFTTLSGQAIYFSLPDVRDFNYCLATNPDSCMCQLLYRTANDYKDFTGGMNRYARVRFDMITDMAFWF